MTTESTNFRYPFVSTAKHISGFLVLALAFSATGTVLAQSEDEEAGIL